MTAAARVPDWHVTRGDAFNQRVVIEAYTITGRTWRSQVRVNSNSTVAATFTITAADGTGDEVGNVTLDFYLAASVTVGLVGRYEWDLEQTENLMPVTLLRGVLQVSEDITQ